MVNFQSIQGVMNLQAHYTEADEIKSLMASLLGDVTGKMILEPAAGEGAFIDALIGNPKQVDAIDVNDSALSAINLNRPFKIRTIHEDFLDLFVSKNLERHLILSPKYDSAISNPPYGLKMSLDYRRLIKKHYPDLYARESFGLFLAFTLECLQEDGRYVFIIPDTFLNSCYHKPLRRALLSRGAPSHVIQFKSGRFKTVNFGYGSLCVIAGNARKTQPNDQILWVDATEYGGPLDISLFKDNARIVQGHTMISACESGWISPDLLEALELKCKYQSLGDIAECRTGFYSGENSRFYGYDKGIGNNHNNGHEINWDNEVRLTALSDQEKSFGISSPPFYVPLVRGGHRAPFEECRWAVNWSHDALEFYRTNKKARLQNASYYFKRGLAVPMVTSGRISASLMDGSVFDQGVVGLFPSDSNLTDFLLLYLNSEVVSKVMKRAINTSANNSANYLKKLPIPVVTEDIINEAKLLVNVAITQGWDSQKKRIEKLVAEALDLPV